VALYVKRIGFTQVAPVELRVKDGGRIVTNLLGRRPSRLAFREQGLCRGRQLGAEQIGIGDPAFGRDKRTTQHNAGQRHGASRRIFERHRSSPAKPDNMPAINSKRRADRFELVNEALDGPILCFGRMIGAPAVELIVENHRAIIAQFECVEQSAVRTPGPAMAEDNRQPLTLQITVDPDIDTPTSDRHHQLTIGRGKLGRAGNDRLGQRGSHDGRNAAKYDRMQHAPLLCVTLKKYVAKTSRERWRIAICALVTDVAAFQATVQLRMC